MSCHHGNLPLCVYLSVTLTLIFDKVEGETRKRQQMTVVQSNQCIIVFSVQFEHVLVRTCPTTSSGLLLVQFCPLSLFSSSFPSSKYTPKTSRSIPIPLDAQVSRDLIGQSWGPGDHDRSVIRQENLSIKQHLLCMCSEH